MQRAIPINFNSITIAAGASAKIYDLRVPQGYVAFINSFANTLENSSCYIKWDIDGGPVTEEKINYTLGKINEPKRYDPPLVVTRKMVVWGFNDGVTNEIFEVLVNGFMVKENEPEEEVGG